ncbi:MULTISPECIES: CoA-acylating methylmalonate-semialdehyde dehydrogenase, partial [Actinomycetota]|uniref:CoA-acylating methylmalonate-semialdehyde dehydrogenase n=1 Tax=Actinomycetota TaxID=201174 RepID=UPI00064C3D9A
EVIASTPLSSREELDRAVSAAGEAFRAWSATPVVDRARVLFRYKMLLEDHFEELRDLVTLENGKDAKDAGGEVRRGIEVVEFACGMPTLMMGESLRDVARGIDNVSYRYPLGVVAAITPFNFPCMVPLWTLPVAIGAGNSYILKPSERTPLTAQRLGELLLEAGGSDLPEGTFSIVNGAREAVDGILEHPGIEAVSFVGSQPVAEHVYRNGSAAGKRVQALAGAKNSMIALPDAVLDKAVPNIVASAYGNAGERCLAGSVLVAVGDSSQQDKLVEAVKEAAKNMKVGPGYEEGSELTPLIRDSHREKVKGYVDLAEEEGATVALDGREPPREEGFFFGPTILDGVTDEMRVSREEIFGPVLSVVRVGSLEEAIEFTNGSDFGNACS